MTSLLIASVVVLVLVLLGFLWWWIVQPHGREALGRDAQLPLFSAKTPGSALRVIGAGARRLSPTTSRGRPATAPAASAPPRVPSPTVAPAVAEAPVVPGRAAEVDVSTGSAPVPGRSTLPEPGANGRAPLEVNSVAQSRVDDALDAEARWAPPAQPVPANGTVEFLPGRLEVVQGRGVAGQEVRFVRPTRAGERPVVTFGRGEGPPYRHVQLNVPTVSRLHARLSLDAESGDWAVENLSSTNPTVLNGQELPADDGSPRPLQDGDRLEMGEVVFTYHAK